MSDTVDLNKLSWDEIKALVSRFRPDQIGQELLRLLSEPGAVENFTSSLLRNAPSEELDRVCELLGKLLYTLQTKMPGGRS